MSATTGLQAASGIASTMDSFHRQGSEGLDGAAQLLITFAASGRTEEPAANASHVPPPTKETDAQGISEAPRLPMPPSNPSVLRKACQIWQCLRACAEDPGSEDVKESWLRTKFKNTADTSKAVRKMNEDGLLQRSGQGGKGNPFLYRVTPASLTTAHYATAPVEKRAGGRRRMAAPVTRRAAGRLPAPACGFSQAITQRASAVPAAPAAFSDLAELAAAAEVKAGFGGATVRGESPSARWEADLGAEPPRKWLKKPRSAGRRPPRPVTPPQEGAWWE